MIDLETPCLCIGMRSAAQRLTQVYDVVLDGTGLNVTQLSQLVAIRKLETPTLRDLSAFTGLDRSTLGRNVRVLERLGLVRITAGEDARTRTLTVTEDGAQALRAALPRWYAIQERLLEHLGGRGAFDALLADLEGAASAIARDAGEVARDADGAARARRAATN